MARFSVLANAVYANGDRQIASTAVPTNLAFVTVYVDVTDIAVAGGENSGVRVLLEFSLDGGANWGLPFVGELRGGQPGGPGGPPSPPFISSIGIQIPDPLNANRRVRGTITVFGGPFRMSAEAEFVTYP